MIGILLHVFYQNHGKTVLQIGQAVSIILQPVIHIHKLAMALRVGTHCQFIQLVSLQDQHKKGVTVLWNDRNVRLIVLTPFTRPVSLSGKQHNPLATLHHRVWDTKPFVFDCGLCAICFSLQNYYCYDFGQERSDL